MCDVISPLHGQLHAVFGGLFSISGGRMLLCKDLSWISEASSHITLQGITIKCGLGVLAGIDVL